ncbi:hypothetical protein ABZT49_05470 [Methylobacterium sp. EM32]|uniref:hypothetical protein n=1 Tax=Methylobacterium sp. EM32 TaxID=3163481 RepID=UPI0033AE4802
MVAVLAIVGLSSSLTLSEACAAGPILQPGFTIGGVAAPALSAEWWKWAMAVPSARSPVADRDGAQCADRQSGDAWFLAGGFGSAKITRTCRIPAGKHLFFPLINMAYWRPANSPLLTCDVARKAAALNNEHAVDLFLELDGTSFDDLARYRAATKECFNLFANASPQSGVYDAFPTASDGFWIALAPLKPGLHVLKFGGRYNRASGAYGRMLQDIEYRLIVE